MNMGISSSASKLPQASATTKDRHRSSSSIGMEPQWPHSVPSRHATLIFSVLCGNSRLHWAFHGNQQENYHPKLFWRTEPPNPDDENEQLASFLPHEILQEIYGKTPTSTTSTTTDTTTTTSPTGPSLPESSSSGIGIGTPSSSLAAAASRAWTAAQAIHYRTNQRVPTIYVYLMDSNHQHAKALTNLLLGDHQQSNSTQKRRNKIPVVVYRLRQNDFEPLLATSSSTSKSTTAAAAYVGMGIDRIANIVAARYLAPNASAHLVIDGGTATTYTASMPSSSQKPTTTTLCGGIGAGLRLKFRSLYDYTWNLPLIQYEHVVNIIQQAETTQTPLQVLELSIWAAAEVAADAGTEEEEMDVATTTTTTDGPVDSSSSPTTTTAVVGELVRKSIVANVLTETALLLCNVIRNWCMETQENTPSDNEKQMLPTVFITGGDGDIMEKLLRPEHSHIVKTNPANAQLLQAAHWTSNEDDDAEETPSTVAAATASSHDTAQFRIQKNSKLTHFAVQALLLSHSGFSSEAKTSSSSQSEHVEWQRELIGHRVAVPQSGTDTTTTNVRYGSILYAFLPSSSRRKKVDPNNVYFYVFYDDDNDDDSNDASRQVDHHHLSLEQIYDALKLYVQSNEKAKIADEYRKMKMAIKEKDAQEMITVLEKKSVVIQKLLASRAAQLAQTATRAVSSGKRPAESTEESSTKKVKTAPTTTASTAVETTQSEDHTVEPSSDPFIGRRMAKFFSKDLFFGTVYDCYEDEDMIRNWGVFYEDGDKEDMEWKAINKALALYEKHKAKDAKRDWTSEQLLSDVKERLAEAIDDQEDD